MTLSKYAVSNHIDRQNILEILTQIAISDISKTFQIQFSAVSRSIIWHHEFKILQKTAECKIFKILIFRTIMLVSYMSHNQAFALVILSEEDLDHQQLPEIQIVPLSSLKLKSEVPNSNPF
jgi:hypothetical protein